MKAAWSHRQSDYAIVLEQSDERFVVELKGDLHAWPLPWSVVVDAFSRCEAIDRSKTLVNAVRYTWSDVTGGYSTP